MNKKVYKFPSLIKLVKGFKSSIILDLHRSDWYSIPNSMYEYIIQYEYNNIVKCIQRNINNEDREIVKDYYQFLIDNELIFEINKNEKVFFPSVVPKYDVPELITNSVLLINNENFKRFKIIFSKIKKTGCKFFQLKLDFKVNKNDLSIIEALFFNTNILSVDIIIKELDKNIVVNEIVSFVKNVGRVKNLCIHKSTKNEILRSNTNMDNIIYLESEADFNKEYIGMDNFIVNDLSYSESLEFNLYFNKKLYIDDIGNIKNSNHSKSFGNIFVNDLISIVSSAKFQRLWFITKEKIETCSDCEFRNICIDYRIPIKKEMKYYYKEVDACNYNPYLAKWKGEEGYISVKKMTIEEIEAIKTENA